MDAPGPVELRLIAGAPGADRMRLGRPASHPRWFEPHHVRDRPAVRAEMAGQVAAGADVLVAPTWLTHRRALLPIGETRRAREWTLAAIEVAREAIDAGLERRAADADPMRAGDAGPQGPVMVLGVVPDVGRIADRGAGRQPARESGVERDEHEAAAQLADAGVDGILLESRATADRLQGSIAAAVETGVPVWAAVDVAGQGSALDRAPTDPGPWFEAALRGRASSILLRPVGGAPAPEAVAAAAGALPEVPVGVLFRKPPVDPTLPDLLAAGAVCLGLEQHADPARLAPLRNALDAVASDRRQARADAEARWTAFVASASRAAPRGPALWIGPQRGVRPDGFDWATARSDEVGHLPRDRFRLIVTTDAGNDPLRLTAALERGGVLVLDRAGDASLARLGGHGLRALELGRHDPGWLVARRER
jgi:hypothetical protein